MQVASKNFTAAAILKCLVFAALGQPASAAEAPAFMPLVLHELSRPSATDPLQTIVWPKEILAQNQYVTSELKRPLNGKNALISAMSATFPDGKGAIIVSVISSRGCVSGANHFTSGIEASDCPLRVVTLRDGKAIRVHDARACFVEVSKTPAEAASDGTFVRFDPAQRTLQIKTIIAGLLAPECTKNLSLAR